MFYFRISKMFVPILGSEFEGEHFKMDVVLIILIFEC